MTPPPSRVSSQVNYYRATADGAAYPPLAGRADCAVCVIGGGFAGLNTALSLLERGERDVIVLEAETIGHGASGRNGGFVFGGFSLGESALLRSCGPAEARRLYRSTLDAVDLIRRRIERHGIDCDPVHAGVYLANWFDDDRLLHDRRRLMLDHFGVDWQLIGRDEFSALARSRRYFGALYEPDAFHFHPLKYAHGLARALSAGGIGIHEGSRVTALIRDGAQGWRVTTGSGEVRARDVILCGGGYLGRLHAQLARATLPVATYVMVTEPLGARLADVLGTSAAIYDTRFAFDYYRPLPDTRLLWGGRISVRDRAAGAVARLLAADMRKVYPQLAGVRIDHAWSGTMSYGRHQMPQMGHLGDGLWFGSGFGGHGVAPTTLCGELLAQAVLGAPQELDRFARWGLARTGGLAGLGAAQLTYWLRSLQDRLRTRA